MEGFNCFHCFYSEIFKYHYMFETLWLHQTFTNCLIRQKCRVNIYIYLWLSHSGLRHFDSKPRNIFLIIGSCHFGTICFIISWYFSSFLHFISFLFIDKIFLLFFFYIFITGIRNCYTLRIAITLLLWTWWVSFLYTNKTLKTSTLLLPISS